jgi:3-oxoacyl-[acyl-carrier protein] reductase
LEVAKALGPRGVRLGLPRHDQHTSHDSFAKDEVRKNVAAATGLKREGRAEEVAGVVVFLASEEAAFVNGVSLGVNGGLLFS